MIDGIKKAQRNFERDIDGNPIPDKYACIWITDNRDNLVCIPFHESNNVYLQYLEWVKNGGVPTDEVVDEWIKIREQRDIRLTNSDWTQGSDSPLTASKKTEWATYREKLRDLPSEQSSKTKYLDIVWPTKP